jgi:hypothetical protein
MLVLLPLPFGSRRLSEMESELAVADWKRR